ncbi:hypothetical protein NIIDMKKI_22090 [Mycobacterium kansasii]|uniref:Uncharacterized protein n=1 Tax=Mycobacterium kansasii TaxID=1768 RepID=A0A7G1I9L0_MYCKA|nr:hypothetical protein NIIDMKKI_22090 [Mycobacterium kansasii]
MITGPGQPQRSMLPEDPRMLSIAQFWQRTAGDNRIVADEVAVIGGGETAASILNELFHHRVSTITAISPQATLFTRGEGFFENSLFSDPAQWCSLTRAERRDYIARTDRGCSPRGHRSYCLPTRESGICGGGWPMRKIVPGVSGSRCTPTGPSRRTGVVLPRRE